MRTRITPRGRDYSLVTRSTDRPMRSVAPWLPVASISGSSQRLGQAPRHRLYERWRGEKPSVFDDTRKFLAAALLIGVGESSPK